MTDILVRNSGLFYGYPKAARRVKTGRITRHLAKQPQIRYLGLMSPRRPELSALLASASLHLAFALAAALLLRTAARPERAAESAGPRLRIGPPILVTAEPPRRAALARAKADPRAPSRGDVEAAPASGAEAPTAAAEGSGAVPAAWPSFASRLGGALRRNLRYPRSLQRQGRQGSVQLRIVLGKEGNLSGSLASGSGDTELDRLALEAMERVLTDASVRQDAKKLSAGAERELALTVPVRFVTR